MPTGDDTASEGKDTLPDLSRDALADVAVEMGVNPEGKSKDELVDLLRAANPKGSTGEDHDEDRFPATDDVVALGLIGFAIVASSGLLYSDGTLPVWLTFVDTVAILTAVVWVFGRGAFKTATSAARTVLERIAKSG